MGRRSRTTVMVVHNPFWPDMRPLNEARMLQAAGWEVTILAQSHPLLPVDEEMHDISIERPDKAQTGSKDPMDPRFYSDLPAMARRIRELDPTVVHLHDLWTLPLAPWAFKHNYRVVYDAHEPDYASLIAYQETRPTWKRFRTLFFRHRGGGLHPPSPERHQLP